MAETRSAAGTERPGFKTPMGEEFGRIAEEIANSVTHGVGLGLSLAGAAVLVLLGAEREGTRHLVGFGVYGAALVLMYTASTLYHSFRIPRWKRILQIADHAAIYVLIAGTYTPFTLVNLEGSRWGTTLLWAVWTFAVLGILYKIFMFGRHPRFSTAAYLVMSWLIFLGMQPIAHLIPVAGIIWLLAGGVFYTAGVWFYRKDRQRFYHAVWHLFVLLGSLCHYIAVLVSTLPVG